MFLHSPEAVVMDLVVVEVVDIDIVALVIRFVAVDRIIPAKSVASGSWMRKRRNLEAFRECVRAINRGERSLMQAPHRTANSSRSARILPSATRKYLGE